MSKHPLAATAEGMPAQTARDLLSDMEDDLHIVKDHALVLNNALTGKGDLPVKLRHALAHTSCQLLGIGEKLSAFHEAMHDALRSPEVREASEPAELTAAPHDPLLDLIRRYEAEEARFNATDHASEAEAEADMEHLDELFRELRDNPPVATTEAGAVAALRLVDEFLYHSSGGFEHALIHAAMAYFDGRA